MRRMAMLVLAVALAAPARAEPDLRQMVVEHRLANGMKFLLVRRPGAPVFTAYLRVKAGGADERPGKTGLAHLLEHLAFKGTPVVGTRDWAQEEPVLAELAAAGDELVALGRSPRAVPVQGRIEELARKAKAWERENAFTELLVRNGASGLNAETDKDLTSYYVSLPSNRFELWALLEASRLAAPVLRGFYSERAVVLEERRERVEGEPLGVLLEELGLVAFTASPYRWPTVGYPADLESLHMRDALEFHRTYYAPGNVVAAVVGDLDLATAPAVLERTFGAIPARPVPPPLGTADLARRSERRATVFFDASPQVVVAFQKPTLPTKDDYVFDVLEMLMNEGRTARLFRALVTEGRLCSEVMGTMTPGARLPHLYAVLATPLADKTPESVEAAILAEFERLQGELVTDGELARVRAKLDADFSRQIASNAGLAESLSFFDAVAGDWRYLADHRRQIASVTAEDVRRIARQYLVPANRTVVYLQRPGATR